MSQEPTEKEISTALEKLTITNDLEKNGEHTETASLFKPKILCAIDPIKEKKKRPDTENVLVNKKTSLGDSFRRINTPQILVNSLDSDSCSNNELTTDIEMLTSKLLLPQMTIFPA